MTLCLPAGHITAPKPKLTGDPTRDKCRQLFAESLILAVGELNEGDLEQDVARIAAEIEDAMFSQNGGVTKDSKNPDLRARMLQGVHTPQELITLSSEELASAARQQENEKIREWALFEAERGKQMKEATTDQFQCGKCKERKTRYFQMQTRSADEVGSSIIMSLCNGH
eukprot:scaffold8525_cov45-Prasinocladus_malaysianus.AAC.1